jgi:hypothetical protein
MVAPYHFGDCMRRKWSKYSERIISEVEAKHGIAWDTDATIFLLSFFIEQVSTQRQFRQFLEKHAKLEKEALIIEQQHAQGNHRCTSGEER